MSESADAPSRMVTLKRELGKWDLTAIGVNQVIGGAVFALPAALAATIVIHLAFYKLLKVPLPWGVFERFAF